jgi:hypothetical protein
MEATLTRLLRRGLIAGAIAAASSAAGQQVTITGSNSLRFAPMTVHVHTGKCGSR